jgi:nitrogen fixation NifU-like protein
MYTRKLLAHFKHPRNYGKLANPDGVGKVGSPVCGDVMHMYIKVGKNKRGQEIIKNIKFQTFGCVAAIGTSSVVTEMVKGRSLEYAENITPQDVIKKIGGLPPIKTHCSLLAIQGLRAAIKDYRKKVKNKNERT